MFKENYRPFEIRATAPGGSPGGVSSDRFLPLRGVLAFAAAALIVLATRSVWAEPSSELTSPHRSTAELVQAAMESELGDGLENRVVLLRQAIAQSPDDGPARWQSGQVRAGRDWLSPSEVARVARRDQRLVEYQRRRDAAEDTVADQAALARWCRQNRLADQQRVHWMKVLTLEPNNAEAIQGLDLRQFQGMLLTPDQIAELKARVHDMHQAIQHWAPLVRRWRKALEDKDEAARKIVAEKVTAADSPGKLMALELVIRQRLGGGKSNNDRTAFRQVSDDMVAVLKDMAGPMAAEALARYAVYSPFDSARSAACSALKDRPLDHYAPLMLSWMATPIATEVHSARGLFGGVTSEQSFFREGPLFNVSYKVINSSTAPWESELDLWQRLLDGSAGTVRPEPVTTDANFLAGAAARQQAIEKLNTEVAEQNGRIASALIQSTGVNFGSDPVKWWDWWLKYNDWYDFSTQGKKKPTVSYLEYHVPLPHSCFAKGTKVWTLTGPVAIEEIKAGDRVLSQDVETGELQYKPVLRTTINHTGQTMMVKLAKETIHCTAGHPMWVVGEGWRLARRLATGERLHTLAGAAMIENIEKVEPDSTEIEDAYNLIVADFSTYFVGKQGLLVHDNTPRQPTAVLLPGLVNRPDQTASHDH
jgi:hypothetical protein